MRWLSLVTLIGLALAQDTTTTTTSDTSSDTSTSRSSTSYDISDASTITGSVALPSGTYETYSSTITLGNGDTSLEAVTTSIAANATTTGNQTVVRTTSNSVTVLVGGVVPQR
ncbi:secreted protein [Penicillium atrosanguineum]|nr:secreted protein [Penicillium atrosanguineum]